MSCILNEAVLSVGFLISVLIPVRALVVVVFLDWTRQAVSGGYGGDPWLCQPATCVSLQQLQPR